MLYIVCTDDRRGLSFGGRRLSRDRVLTERLHTRLCGMTCLCSPYTAKVYGTADTVLTDDPAARREDGAYIAETFDPTPYLCSGDRLLVFCFGRAYPFDVRLTADLSALPLLGRQEFVGHSHPCLTEEEYIIP